MRDPYIVLLSNCGFSLPSAQGRPYFCYGSKWNSIYACAVCIFFHHLYHLKFTTCSSFFLPF